ncbi:MAG: hypothetical protein WA432_02915 [Candidatus Babeliaceae bacterium]
MQTCFLQKDKYECYMVLCNRNDSMHVFSDFLEDTSPSDIDYIQWLLNPERRDMLTEMMYIEKFQGMLFVRDRYEEYDTTTVLSIAALTFVRIIREIQYLKETYKPGEIVVMRENGQYFVKRVTISSLAFIKTDNGNHKLSSFWSDHKLGALGRFLLSTQDFSSFQEWLFSEQQEKPFALGQLIKKNGHIIIQYKNAYYDDYMLHTIKPSVLNNLIKTYIQLMADQPEELLLIHEPEYYSFMINPHEEIKIPIL